MPENKPLTFKLLKEHAPDLFVELRELNEALSFKAVGIKTEDQAAWFGEFEKPRDLRVILTKTSYY